MTMLVALLALAAPPPVEAIAQQINDRYVLVDEAPRIADWLRQRARDGAYDHVDGHAALAQALTNDLREFSGDLHFAVEHDPSHAARLIQAGAAERRELPEIGHTPEELAHMRRTNYGFRRVETLPGNVVLIQLTRFDDLPLSRDTATSAMGFAANADAVIVDIRDNPGGKGDSVNFLISYFLTGEVELMATFDRETGKTTIGRSLTSVPGKRMPEVPLFILTGPGTGSAAEAFAFSLQQLGRATIVGERTAGAAQGGGWVPVGDGFVVFIPTFRPFNPGTGDNWQGTGIQPHIAVTIDRALEVAHLHAVVALERKASTHELRWLLPLLDLAANGPAQADTHDLPGQYEGIEVSADEGELRFLGASGIVRTMTPLSDGTFLIEDASVPDFVQARVRFVRDASGACTGLELLTHIGRVIPRSRR